MKNARVRCGRPLFQHRRDDLRVINHQRHRRAGGVAQFDEFGRVRQLPKLLGVAECVARNLSQRHVPMIKARLARRRIDGEVMSANLHGHARVVARLIPEMQPQGRQFFTLDRFLRRPNAHAHDARVRQSVAHIDDKLLVSRHHQYIRRNRRYGRPFGHRLPRVLRAVVRPLGLHALPGHQILEVRPARVQREFLLLRLQHFLHRQPLLLHFFARALHRGRVLRLKAFREPAHAQSIMHRRRPVAAHCGQLQCPPGLSAVLRELPGGHLQHVRAVLEAIFRGGFWRQIA